MQEAIQSGEQIDSMQRNELNYWNGKVQNMRRDLELQQNYNQRMQQENREMKRMLEDASRNLQLGRNREATMERQIQGLEEDNQRLAKMYEQLTCAPPTHVHIHHEPARHEPQFLMPATANEKSRNEEDSTPGKAGRFTSVSKEFGGASFASKRTDPGNGTRKFNNAQGTPTSQTMKRGL